MKPSVVYTVGALVILLTIALAASAKATPMAPVVPPEPQPPGPKPNASKPSTTKPTASTPPAVTLPTIDITPAQRTNVPLDIVNVTLATGDANAMKAQGIWLRDNGFPLTADGIEAYLRGDLSADALRELARNEGE